MRRPRGWSETRICPKCESSFVVSGRRGRKRYCSVKCLPGKPRTMSEKTCPTCGRLFRRSGVTYCSRACGMAARRGPNWQSARLLPFRAPPAPRVERNCPICGKLFTVKGSRAVGPRYCSKACVAAAFRVQMLSAGNPNYRDALRKKSCLECGRPIQGYRDNIKFCSRKCKHESEWFISQMRLKGRKDLNHDVIQNAFLQLGCSVLDLSAQGRGVPDLIVACGGVIHLVEIKNPETYYGRRGLNKRQQAFKERFGGCVENVATVEDVAALVIAWRREPERRIWAS